MYPSTHFLATFLVAEVLVQVGIFNHYHALIAAVLTVLLDLDHYISYALRHKDFNFIHFWNDANTYLEEGRRMW
ncbi:hypothetical protein ACFL96_13870, partial [Thermoproteota archaeon]